MLQVSPGADARVRPHTTCERSPIATVPGCRCCLSGLSSPQSLYQSQGDWAKPRHRAPRSSATSPSCLDVHRGCQRRSQAEKAGGRASFRNHQGATGRTEIPAARPLQCDGLLDPLGHRLQLAHTLEDLEFLRPSSAFHLTDPNPSHHTFHELRLIVYSPLSFDLSFGSNHTDNNGLLRQAQYGTLRPPNGMRASLPLGAKGHHPFKSL